MIGALADALHRVPMAVGRADGWGMDDTAVTVAVMLSTLLIVAFVARLLPGHSGRRASWRIFGRRPQPFLLLLAALNLWTGWHLAKGATNGGTLLQGPFGVALGAVSAVAAAMMIAGWWLPSHRAPRPHRWALVDRIAAHIRSGAGLMPLGMVTSSIIWAGLAAAYLMGGLTYFAGVALIVSGMAGASWLAEVTDIGADPGPP